MIAVRSYHRAKRSDKGRSGCGFRQAIRRIMARYRQAQRAWCPGQALPDQGQSRAMGRGKHFPENMKERGVNNKKANKWIKFIGMKMKKSDASDEPTTPIHISF